MPTFTKEGAKADQILFRDGLAFQKVFGKVGVFVRLKPLFTCPLKVQPIISRCIAILGDLTPKHPV